MEIDAPALGLCMDQFNTTMLKAWCGYFVYDTDEWEHIGEYYRFNNKDLSGGSGTHDSWAGFLQAGMRLGRWTPYGRLERAVLDQTDNYFREQLSGRSYARQALGLNYELSPKAALKLELSQTRLDDSPDANEARFQYAIRF